MALTRQRSVPGGACSPSTSAMSARCQECSAEFSRRDPSARELCLITVFSRSASSTKRSWLSSDSPDPMEPSIPGGAGGPLGHPACPAAEQACHHHLGDPIDES